MGFALFLPGRAQYLGTAGGIPGADLGARLFKRGQAHVSVAGAAKLDRQPLELVAQLEQPRLVGVRPKRSQQAAQRTGRHPGAMDVLGVGVVEAERRVVLQEAVKASRQLCLEDSDH